MLVIRAGIHKMLVRIVNREDPDQTAFLCLCLFGRQLVFRILEYTGKQTFYAPAIL